MRRILSMLTVCALMAAVVTGCSKGAKINLTGLSENAPGSVGEDSSRNGLNRNGINGDDSLAIKNLSGENGNGGAGMLNGVDPNAPAGWSDTANGLNGVLNGEQFVKNGNYWSEKVYFDFNRYEVRPSERVKLDGLAEHLRSNPTFRVVIEGHTDERGSDEYNRSLAERRSISIQTYLVSLGIEESRMRTVSYGEDRPAVAGAQTEADHQLNRRGEFLVGLP